ARLERLVESGLLTAAYERRTGRSGPGAGRPAKTYSVVPSLESIEFPRRRYETLLGLLLEQLPARGRAQRLHEVGERFAGELAAAAKLRPAASPRKAFDAVCRAVGELGYQATIEQADEHGAVIATPTCPLRPLVREHPEAVDIDRGMWAGLVRRALAGGEVRRVECETRDCLGDHSACRVRISLKISINGI